MHPVSGRASGFVGLTTRTERDLHRPQPGHPQNQRTRNVAHFVDSVSPRSNRVAIRTGRFFRHGFPHPTGQWLLGWARLFDGCFQAGNQFGFAASYRQIEGLKTKAKNFRRQGSEIFPTTMARSRSFRTATRMSHKIRKQ